MITSSAIPAMRAVRVLRSLLVAVVAMGLGLVMAGPARAAKPGDINPDTQGSILVQRHAIPKGGTVGDAKPAPGVTIAIARVTSVDLTTVAGWADVASLMDLMTSGTAHVVTLGPRQTLVTDSRGEALFEDLPVGLYRVWEIASPDGHISMDPYYVTVPIQHPVSGDWLHQVTTIPKYGLVEEGTELPTSTPTPTVTVTATATATITPTPPLPTTGGDFNFVRNINPRSTPQLLLTGGGARLPRVAGVPPLPRTGAEIAGLAFAAAGLATSGTWLVLAVKRHRQNNL